MYDFWPLLYSYSVIICYVYLYEKKCSNIDRLYIFYDTLEISINCGTLRTQLGLHEGRTARYVSIFIVSRH
jgi:hypothetical protein